MYLSQPILYLCNQVYSSIGPYYKKVRMSVVYEKHCWYKITTTIIYCVYVLLYNTKLLFVK